MVYCKKNGQYSNICLIPQDDPMAESYGFLKMVLRLVLLEIQVEDLKAWCPATRMAK